MELDDQITSGMNKLYSNNIARATIGLFLILYTGLIAPKLPKSILKIIDNYFVKAIIIFFIAFMGKQNKTIAIISTIAFLVTIQAINKMKISEKFTDNQFMNSDNLDNANFKELDDRFKASS